MIVNKRDKRCQIIDVAIPENGRVREKEDGKVEKYQDLAREVRKMWDARTKVIPVVMGALGSVPMNLKNNLKVIDVELCGNDPEMYTVVVTNKFKKGARDVEERKSSRLCYQEPEKKPALTLVRTTKVITPPWYKGRLVEPSHEVLICCSLSKLFCLQWKAFDLLKKMMYILWVVALLEACGVTKHGRLLGSLLR